MAFYSSFKFGDTSETGIAKKFDSGLTARKAKTLNAFKKIANEFATDAIIEDSEANTTLKIPKKSVLVDVKYLEKSFSTIDSDIIETNENTETITFVADHLSAARKSLKTRRIPFVITTIIGIILAIMGFFLVLQMKHEI